MLRGAGFGSKRPGLKPLSYLLAAVGSTQASQGTVLGVRVLPCRMRVMTRPPGAVVKRLTRPRPTASRWRLAQLSAASSEVLAGCVGEWTSPTVTAHNVAEKYRTSQGWCGLKLIIWDY